MRIEYVYSPDVTNALSLLEIRLQQVQMHIINSKQGSGSKELSRSVIDCAKELKSRMVRIRETAIPLQVNIIEDGDNYG